MKRFGCVGLLASLLFAGSLGAQGELWRVLDRPGGPADQRLKGAVTLDGYHPWKPPGDLTAWKKRREKVRRQILVAAGLWPMPPKTPLEPVIHGKIDRDAYTVEKVYFQSYPGFFVTGNLYRPKGGKARRPAVLSPHGHWRNGRLSEVSEKDARGLVERGEEKTMEGARYHIQARCVMLARLGCVVFHYDMVGYADSKQIGHRQGFGDPEAELRLESAFGLQTWNTVRSFDFLLSLPDVDPHRIGVTGASGGGTQTFTLCAIDDRPAVGFPAVMVSTDMQGGCICENASHLRVGTTNIEFAALAAPRPYGMTAANDWTKEIPSKGLPELKKLYGLYGKEGLVEAFCHLEFGHNYNQVSREHMYNWFNRHLELGHPSPVKEKPFQPVPPAELSVFDDEHRLAESAVDAGKLRQWLTETSGRQIAALVPGDVGGLAEFRRVIGGALESLLHTSLPSPGEVSSTGYGETTIEGRGLHKLTLRRKGSGEEVPALFLKPANWNGVAIVAVNPEGKSALFSRPDGEGSAGTLNGITRAVLETGAAILAPDVFLTGEFLPEEARAVPDIGPTGPDSRLFKKDSRRHAGFVGYSYGYNRTLLAERVHDILTVIAHARALPGCKSVHLAAGREAAGWIVLAGALAGPAVSKIILGDHRLTDYDSMRSHDHPDFLPRALKYGGMPYFMALCAPTPLWLLSEGAPGEVVRAAYRAAGRPDGLRHLPPGTDPGSGESVLDWISRPE